MPRWMTGINVKDLGQAVKKQTKQGNNKTKQNPLKRNETR